MTSKYIVLSGALALLLTAAPALAHDDSVAAGAKADAGLGLHLGQIFHGDNDTDTDNDNDVDHAGGQKVQLTAEQKASLRAQFADKLAHLTAGVVTAVNGSSFTIDPLGAKSTTTVTTSSSTVVKAKGDATSSAAVAVGDHVVVMGTTTATSDSGDTFAAAVVRIVGKGWLHLRHWFFLH